MPNRRCANLIGCHVSVEWQRGPKRSQPVGLGDTRPVTACQAEAAAAPGVVVARLLQAIE